MNTGQAHCLEVNGSKREVELSIGTERADIGHDSTQLWTTMKLNRSGCSLQTPGELERALPTGDTDLVNSYGILMKKFEAAGIRIAQLQSTDATKTACVQGVEQPVSGVLNEPRKPWSIAKHSS